MKYSKKVADKIIQLFTTGEHSIQQICEAVRITRDTFYTWKNTKPEFTAWLNEAESRRLDNIKEMAISGLAVLLVGKEYEEVTTEYIEGRPDKDGNTKPKIKLQRKVKKFILPNPTSIIFTLKNLDNEHFADIFRSEITERKITVEIED